jgi:hypothetical protein
MRRPCCRGRESQWSGRAPRGRQRQSLALMDGRGVHQLRNTLQQAMYFKERAGIAQPGCSYAVLVLVSCQLTLSSVCSSPRDQLSEILSVSHHLILLRARCMIMLCHEATFSCCFPCRPVSDSNSFQIIANTAHAASCLCVEHDVPQGLRVGRDDRSSARAD